MLGIDVSKDTLALTLLDPVSRKVTWEKTVPNSPKGVESILAHIPVEIPWVLEPTGRDSLRVVEQAVAARRTVLQAQPKRAKAVLAGLQSRAKTDRLDSRGLAWYGLSAELKPYPLKDAPTHKLEQLLAARKAASQTAARLSQQQAELPAAKDARAPIVAAARAQITAIDRQLPKLTAAAALAAPVQALRAVPGIGPVTAATVVACLRAKAFADADAFVAYTGLDLRVRDSGKATGRRRLSKQGDAELRRLLDLCAQANLCSKDSPFRAQYARERAKGLSTTAALCAVARKLARVCWALVTQQTPYDPARVYRQPSQRPNATHDESEKTPVTP